MKKIVSKDLDFDIQLEEILSLDRGVPVDINETVKNIISDVKENGDESLIKLTNKLDNNNLSLDNILVSQDEIEFASENISNELKQAIQLSHDRVTAYHQKQLPEDLNYKDDLGIELGYIWNSIESAGVYVPGGTASYPSSVIMNTVPAKVAGVENITMVTPANSGKINPLVLYAAKISGVDKIFKIGGILNKNYHWNTDQKTIQQWIQGETKDDFVNANMIELRETGFMSNRGRQNVASYFSKELLLDWRIGAAYFESMLIDYDVHSNYGNWMYVAGVGNDPRDRKFNTQLQAERYDQNHKYRKLWLEKTLF